MSVRIALIALMMWALGAAAHAQGFAGLGQTTDGFDLPAPETRFVFPEDHGPHNTFRIEWWYVTANLQTSDGTPYGIQWTLFRSTRFQSVARSKAHV